MTEIPEHLKRRAEEARIRAAEGGGEIPAHLLARSKARQESAPDVTDVDYEIVNLNGTDYVPKAVFDLVETERDWFLNLLEEIGAAPDDVPTGPTFVSGSKSGDSQAVKSADAFPIDFAQIGRNFLEAIDEYRPLIDKVLKGAKK